MLLHQKTSTWTLFQVTSPYLDAGYYVGAGVTNSNDNSPYLDAGYNGHNEVNNSKSTSHYLDAGYYV